jgi:tRNA(Ile)-lysidine synthase
MFSHGDAVLAGVSGGPDSMALMHLLVYLAPEFGLQLTVVHLNHGLRPETAERDARFVARAAARLGLPCVVEKRDVAQYQRRRRLSLEEAARQVRYDFFSKTADRYGCSRIALGHHADDNAEQVLMNLLRGSGPLGLSGIPPVRPIDTRHGRQATSDLQPMVVRPLIAATRAQILGFLSARSVPFLEDESNADLRHLRNRVRGQLLPLIKSAYNPNIVMTLNRVSAILRSEEHWLEARTRDLFAQFAATGRRGNEITLPLVELSALYPAACRRLIRRAVREIKGDLRRISFEHVAAIEALISDTKPFARVDLPGGIHAIRGNGSLTISGRLESCPPISFRRSVPSPMGKVLTLTIPETGDRLRFSETGLPDLLEIRSAGQRVAFFDMDKLAFPLTVRNFRPGDRFTPFGMQGTKKVKKYFSDSGVPPDRRRRCPLVVSGGEIIWLAGFRIGASAQVDDTTSRVIKAELFLA